MQRANNDREHVEGRSLHKLLLSVCRSCSLFLIQGDRHAAIDNQPEMCQ